MTAERAILAVQGPNARARVAELSADAAEVKRLAGGFLAPVRGEIAAKVTTLELPLAELPTKAQWEEKAKEGAKGLVRDRQDLERRRRIAQELTPRLGQSVVVENIGGAGVSL